MITLDRNEYRRFKDGEIAPKQFAEYLLRTYSAFDIALSFVELVDGVSKPITITQEEFDAHFRIKGIRADGTVERRGRPSVYENRLNSAIQKNP